MIPGHERLSAPRAILAGTASASAPLPARVSAVAADVVDADGLGVRAAEVAARQRSPQTRRTYASVYRSLLAFLGEHATVDQLTPEAVRAYRDALEHADRTPATIAKHLSAIRGLAAAVGADADVRAVRSASVARGEPRALSHEEFARLLKMPDRRTRQGKRDLALLHLLGSAGLRRSEAAALVLGDVDERRRAADPRLRHAIKSLTSWWVTVRYAKRGRTRVVPLDDDALEAIVAWVKSRPPAATEHLLLSMPRAGAPGLLGARDIARIVGRHAGTDTSRRERLPHARPGDAPGKFEPPTPLQALAPSRPADTNPPRDCLDVRATVSDPDFVPLD